MSSNTYNQGGRAGYTFARLPETEAPTANIHPSAAADQAGLSKKQKIN